MRRYPARSHEMWRPVVNWPLYEVSSEGRIRNIKTGRMRMQQTNSWGYKTVNIYSGTIYDRRTVTVHILVAEAFVGPRPTALHKGDHINEIKLDNRANNLQWLTNQENIIKLYRAGKSNSQGENHHKTTLTNREVKEIRSLLKAARKNRIRVPPGYRKELAKTYNVTVSVIGHISSGRSWKHV